MFFQRFAKHFVAVLYLESALLQCFLAAVSTFSFTSTLPFVHLACLKSLVNSNNFEKVNGKDRQERRKNQWIMFFVGSKKHRCFKARLGEFLDKSCGDNEVTSVGPMGFGLSARLLSWLAPCLRPVEVCFESILSKNGKT